MEITKEMTIQEVVAGYPESISVFDRYGLACCGCLAGEFENLEAGASFHGVNLDDLLWDLNHLGTNS